MKTPQEARAEVFRNYCQILEATFEKLKHDKQDEPILGQNDAETLKLVHKRLGYLEGLEDFLAAFRDV